MKLTETPTLRAFWSDRYWQGQEEKLPRGALRAAGAEKQPPGTAARGLLYSPGAGPPRHPSWWRTVLRWSSKCHELGAQGRPVIVVTCLTVRFAGGGGVAVAGLAGTEVRRVPLPRRAISQQTQRTWSKGRAVKAQRLQSPRQ